MIEEYNQKTKYICIYNSMYMIYWYTYEIIERGLLSDTSDSDEQDIAFVGAYADPHFLWTVHDPDFDDWRI